MPISPELQAFLAAHRALKAQVDRDIAKIPRLEVAETATLDDLHTGAHWHGIDEKLKQNGLTENERNSVHQALAGMSKIELPVGIFHRLTVDDFRQLTDDELLLLQDAHAAVDKHSIAILRRLFGKIDEPL